MCILADSGDEHEMFDYLWEEERVVHTRQPASVLYQRRDTPQGHQAYVDGLRPLPAEFFNYLRMEENVFEMLLGRLTPYIQKQDTTYRKAIPAKQRLLAALRYFVTGLPLEQHKHVTGISPTALRTIIFEVSLAIIAEFADEYMKVRSGKRMTSIVLYWGFGDCLRLVAFERHNAAQHFL